MKKKKGKQKNEKGKMKMEKEEWKICYSLFVVICLLCKLANVHSG